MSTSSGRKLAQAYIDSQKQYRGRTPTLDETMKHVNQKLNSKAYTVRGFKNLWRWLKK